MRPSPVVLGVFALLSMVVAGRGLAAETVVTDREHGCRIRLPRPEEGKTIRWTGPCRNGFAQGGGVLEWFRDGQPAGWVEGVFADGRLEGPARLEWEDGRAFTGRFRRGQASGPGILTFPEGHRYVGTFDRDRPTGQGEFISSMGTRYRARVDAAGNVWPGAMLGPSPGSEAADIPEPPPRQREPQTLDEWLREPPPVPDLRLSERPVAGGAAANR